MKRLSLIAAMALSALAVSACQYVDSDKIVDDYSGGVPGRVSIWTDPKTGCDYVMWSYSSYGVSMMPRLDAANHMVCSSPQNAAQSPNTTE